MKHFYGLSVAIACFVGLSACGTTPGTRIPHFQDPLLVVELQIKCVSRDAAGFCTSKTCDRQRAPNMSVEADDCSRWLANCKKAGHTGTGDKESARCTRKD